MKFGLFLLTTHPTTQDPTNKYDELLEQVALLEKNGFDSIWVAEHHTSGDTYFPQLITLAGLASHTRKLSVGTDVMLLPLHHPLKVAEDVAMLDVLTRGRMILGVAIGYRREEFDAFGVSFERRTTILEEQVPLLRRLWSETQVSHHGDFFDLENVTLYPKPIRKTVPIWIGASGAAPDSALDRIARLGDAWHAEQSTPLPIYREKFAYYRKALEKYGKDPRKMEFPLLREMYIAEDPETARRDIENEMIEKYRLYYRWGLPVLRMLYKREEDITFEVLKKDTIIVGDPDECITQVETYEKEMGVNHMIFRIQFKGFSHKKTLSAIRLFSKKVMPYFEKKR